METESGTKTTWGGAHLVPQTSVQEQRDAPEKQFEHQLEVPANRHKFNMLIVLMYQAWVGTGHHKLGFCEKLKTVCIISVSTK